MPLPKLTEEQIVTVFMSMRVNETRLAEEPPLLRTEVSDEQHRMDIENTTLGVSRSWDIYKDVVQLSFYHNGNYSHFMLCDDLTGIKDVTLEPGRLIRVYDDEAQLISEALAYLRGVFGPETSEGSPLYPHLLVGWRMQSEIWPVLINRALRYRIPLYRDMITSPDMRWPTLRHIADLGAIYQQGATFRKLPGLADLLRFWGFWQDEHRPMPEDISAAVCEAPKETAAYIETYLSDMHKVVCLYYGATPLSTEGENPLAGAAVPASYQ